MQVAASAAAARPIGAKGVFAAVLGNGFEFFDFTVYATFLDLIGAAFYPSSNPFVSDLASAATFGVGFVARPLGGALIGAYGDRAGRRPAMTMSIGLMALGCAMIAVAPGYASIGALAPILLIVARLMQGFAVGGEVGPATMFVLEAAPPGRRMLFASWQLASQNLGSLAGGIIGVVLALALSKSSYAAWGWRVPFAIGVLIAPVGLYVRTRLDETLDRRCRPHFIDRAAGQLDARPPRPRAHLRRHDHPVFPHHHDALCDPDPASSALDRHARLGHARDHRLPWSAGGRRVGRPVGDQDRRDRAPGSVHDRAVPGDVVPGRQSGRGDPGRRDRHSEPVARDERRGRGHPHPADFPRRRSLDRPLRHLFARRRDLRRHRDLRRYLARRRHGQSAR